MNTSDEKGPKSRVTAMSQSRPAFNTLILVLVGSLMLVGGCLAAGLALYLDTADLLPRSPAVRIWAWSGVLLGLLFAGSGLAYAGRIGWVFQRSFEDVRERVHLATRRLDSLPVHEQGLPPDLVTHVHCLLDGLDRVIEERQQREREVLRADQLSMVGQIAAGVAHELRNPLTSIKLLIQTNLREAAREGGPTDDLTIIDHEILRMEKCLQRFLDFARPPRPERRPTDLKVLVERTLALVDGRARKQHVTLSFDPPPTPIVVEADEDQIQQLLVNLVLNALDAMAEGGQIEVRMPPPEEGHVELQVLDTGPGIPTELFPRLFDPFVSTKETGIGLGLAVSHRIATGHGGTLFAVNRDEGGTCFSLRLPHSET